MLIPIKNTGHFWRDFPLISDIRALWRSTLSARVPECQKLDLDGTEHF